MNTKSLKNKRLPAYLFCLLAAALIMMFCTKSSFLYPLNDWEDANILFTLGRGMMHGRVPYLELYDQKGPFSFFLYGLASLVSNTSFIGLYILETLCFSGFLYFSWRSIALFEKQNALYAVPLLGALVASAMSFAHGGSVEELVLPALAFSLYDILRYYRLEYPKPMPFWRLMLHGALAGCLLWTKYTMLGFYIAWILVLFIALLVARRVGRAFLSALVFLGGMLVITLPWLLYFEANGGLSNMFRYYFLYNIFGYSGEAARGPLSILLNIGKNTLATFRRNPQYSLLIALGILWLTFFKGAGANKIEKWNIWALCVFSCVGIYIGELGYRYYGVVLVVFAALGVVPLLRLYNRIIAPRLSGKKAAPAVAVGVFALAIALCPLLSDNAYMLGTKKDELPQYQFAERMQALSGQVGPSVLCYQMMDGGFYLAAGYEPAFRCFSLLNIAHDEIRQEQDGYLDEGVPAFVVTRKNELSHENYTPVGEASYYYEESQQHYYLYQYTG